MEYFSLLFLYLFLPVSVAVYHLFPDIRRKNLALIAISLLIYTLGQPVYMIAMLVMSFVNYRLAFRIDRNFRGTILLPLVLNLGLLAVFKYLAVVLELFDLQPDFRILPVGFSVFVLSSVSYMMDVYNGTVDPEESFSVLLLYFLMFPKLLTGPLVTYEQMRTQLYRRRSTTRAVFEGIQRFLFGLAKKVLLADACGRIIQAFNDASADNTLVGVWFTAILFMFRVYYDFSGCCDMAIGLGRMFGFRYRENFNRPYSALSVMDFGKRWNISLGDFFRTYVYEPLGGAEMGKPRQIFNILICCVLMGLWHSNGFNYLIWAVYLWLVIALELLLADDRRYWPDWVQRCSTLWFLLFGFIIFSHENLSELKAAVAGTLGYGDFSVAGTGRWIFMSIPLLLVCLIGCTNIPIVVKQVFAGICGMDRRRDRDDSVKVLRIVYGLVCLGVMLLLLWLCTVAMIKNPVLPSIFGQF